MSRALGIDVSISWVKLVWTRVRVVSMTGDSPDTVTVSSSACTLSLAWTSPVKPTVMRIPSRTMVAKPASSKEILYSPAGTPGKR